MMTIDVFRRRAVRCMSCVAACLICVSSPAFGADVNVSRPEWLDSCLVTSAPGIVVRPLDFGAAFVW